MTNPDDNLFDDDLEEEGTYSTPGEPGGGGNRTFLVAAGILGAITLLVVIVGVVLLFVLRRGGSSRLEEAAHINAMNTATSAAATEQAYAAALLLTPSATLPPTATLAPTLTPVVVEASVTPTPEQTIEGAGAELDDPTARTATVAALLTQAAGGGALPTPTPTGLPQSGFADEVGLPLMLGLSALFIVLIFVVRRLRLSTQQ